MCREFPEQFHKAVAPKDDMIKFLGIKQRENDTLKKFLNRYHYIVLDLRSFNYPQALKGLKEGVKIEWL